MTDVCEVVVAARHRHRILVVEDDDAAREALCELLQINAYDVVSVADAEEALCRLGDGASPCLILLDLDLPGKTGWELREEQLRHPRLRDIPVVVFSGQREDRRRVRELGIRDYLTKPTDLTEFFAVIRRYFAKQ